MRNGIARGQATCLLNEFSADVAGYRDRKGADIEGSFGVCNVALGKREKREDLRGASAKFSNVAMTANFANTEKFESSILKAESAFSRIQDPREFNGRRMHVSFRFWLTKFLHHILQLTFK